MTVNEGPWHVENAPAPDQQGCASGRAMGQQSALEHRALLSRVARTGESRQGKGCLSSRAWEPPAGLEPGSRAGAGHKPSMHELGVPVTRSAAWGSSWALLICVRLGALVCHRGMDGPGAEPEALLAAWPGPCCVPQDPSLPKTYEGLL